MTPGALHTHSPYGATTGDGGVSAAEYIVELLVLRTLQLHDFQILRKSPDVNLGNFWP